MKVIPGRLLRDLYVRNSLRWIQNGFTFDLTNRLPGVVVVKVLPLEIDGETWPAAGVSFVTGGQSRTGHQIFPWRPWRVPRGTFKVRVQGKVIDAGRHTVKLSVVARFLGRLEVGFTDTVHQGASEPREPARESETESPRAD
ncbi:MAG: hypothetical protein AB1645_09570 [Bacillota bacterium]